MTAPRYLPVLVLSALCAFQVNAGAANATVTAGTAATGASAARTGTQRASASGGGGDASGARAPTLVLAQAQPEAVPPSGSTFEEEIVPQRYANSRAVDAFISELVARYDFDPQALHTLFGQASYSATAVKLVTPAPTPGVKNWRAYEARFIEGIRINAGVRFWRANQDALQRAADQFGVPPEMIVGIIGVETLYGRYMGNFRVFDALTTLAFDYPDVPNRDDRQATFRKNLEDFLIWTRDSGVDPDSVLGSYTGAIGIPQFLPSSILQYAVDFDGDHRIDLRNSSADAIGSVANYLKQFGWETGRPVVWHIAPDTGSQGIAQAAADGLPEPHWTLDQLLRAGMLMREPGLDAAGEAGTPVTVVDLPTPGNPTAYLLGLKNFYVLTRYNRSFFYALAVYELGQQVKARMLATGDLGRTPVPGTAPGSASAGAYVAPGGASNRSGTAYLPPRPPRALDGSSAPARGTGGGPSSEPAD